MTDKKINIIYCITKANFGGAQRYVYDLATSLPKEAYNIKVLLGSTGTLRDKLNQAGIQTIILGKLGRNINIFTDFSSFIKLVKIFKKERPDIIHLNSSKMGLLGALAGRITHVPKIIFTGHGWAFNEDRSRLQKKLIRLFHLLTVALSHKTITVSEQTKKQIATSDFIEKKTITIKNGLGEINFLDKNIAREKIIEKISGTGADISNKLWIGTVSELHKNKGLKYAIEAMHLLILSISDTSLQPIFVIIGDGEKRKKLQKRIRRYGLQNNIFITGRIDEAEKYLKAFDIFTLTSITEALPYAILEAGKAGLPIIASGVGGIPEIITDMEDGILVRPKEPVEIQKAIGFLLSHPEKMSTFSQNIKSRICTDFTKETMVKNTLEVYNN